MDTDKSARESIRKSNQADQTPPNQSKSVEKDFERKTLVDNSDKNQLPTESSHHFKKSKSARAISLFNVVPTNRSCADAYIEPHWCSCLNLNFVNVTAPIVKRAAGAIVDRINAYTNEERQICHTLSVANVTWAGKLVPHQTLIKFKQNRDLDGYLADLTSTSTKITNELYQLQILVMPGQSIFEASLTHNLISDQFEVNITDISRINKYGDQANCILDKNPDLRKFCYCRTTTLNGEEA